MAWCASGQAPRSYELSCVNHAGISLSKQQQHFHLPVQCVCEETTRCVDLTTNSAHFVGGIRDTVIHLGARRGGPLQKNKKYTSPRLHFLHSPHHPHYRRHHISKSCIPNFAVSSSPLRSCVFPPLSKLIFVARKRRFMCFPPAEQPSDACRQLPWHRLHVQPTDVSSMTVPRRHANDTTDCLPSSVPRCISAVRLPSSVRIVEVSPRDGLQNEKKIVATSVKVSLIHDLVDAGLKSIEVTGFVSPKWVPQLADAAQVMAAIERRKGVSYSALVPNMKGFNAALAVGTSEIAVFASATERFSMKNVNCTIAQSLERFRSVASEALKHGIKVRGYISCTVGCPYEGAVDPKAVANVALALWKMGCYELSLGDTIGVGNPKSIVKMIHAVLDTGIPINALAIHCHDTRGTALANVLAALSVGVSVVDSSVAGLGGCPFAPGAAGNLATEDLVYMLNGMNIDIGNIDLDKLVRIGRQISNYLGRQMSSRVSIAANCSRPVFTDLRTST